MKHWSESCNKLISSKITKPVKKLFRIDHNLTKQYNFDKYDLKTIENIESRYHDAIESFFLFLNCSWDENFGRFLSHLCNSGIFLGPLDN